MIHTSGSGYTYLASDNSVDRPLYIHRLVAYAHGLLDDLDNPYEVHHRNGVAWQNNPENLLVVDPRGHADYHLNGTPIEPIETE